MWWYGCKSLRTALQAATHFLLHWLWTPDYLKLDKHYKPGAVSASEHEYTGVLLKLLAHQPISLLLTSRPVFTNVGDSFYSLPWTHTIFKMSVVWNWGAATLAAEIFSLFPWGWDSCLLFFLCPGASQCSCAEIRHRACRDWRCIP